jgi:hypothetical protein
MKEAPLLTLTMDAAAWLLAHQGAQGVLWEQIQRDALHLLDGVVLALKGTQRDALLEQSDRALLLLRIHLRLAAQSQRLEQTQLVFILGQLDEIGRQFGGWRRRLQRAPQEVSP